MALPTRIGKEVSTGTSTAAIVEASLHGAHPVLMIIILGAGAAAIFCHYIEGRIEENHEANSNHKRGVRNYGLRRMF